MRNGLRHGGIGQDAPSRLKWFGAASLLAIGLGGAASEADAQTACPVAVIGGQCKVTGTAITLTDVTTVLATPNAVGAEATDGEDLVLTRGMATTTVVGANANGQIGLRASGAGSTISASGYTVDLTPASGVTVNMTGVLAEAGGAVILTDSSQVVVTGGTATTAISNHGLVARGGAITMTGGMVSTAARSSFGAWADTGGAITLTDVTVAPPGSPLGRHPVMPCSPAARALRSPPRAAAIRRPAAGSRSSIQPRCCGPRTAGRSPWSAIRRAGRPAAP